MVTQNINDRVQTVLKKSVVLTLEVHLLGNDRKVDTKTFVKEAVGDSEAQMALDSDQFRTTMKLLPQSELLPVLRVQAHAKAYLRSVAIPTHRVFGDRSYLVPLTLVDEVDARLCAFADQVRQEAAKLALRYESAVASQRQSLGKLFNERQYLRASDVATKYSLDWQYVSFAVPDALETVSAKLARRERDRFRSQLEAAYEEVVGGLRGAALDIVSDLEKRLTPQTGKRMVIRETALKDLEEFAALLPSRDLTNDQDLKAVVERLRARVAGTDIHALRMSTRTREVLRAEVAKAKDALMSLVQESGRSIDVAALPA